MPYHVLTHSGKAHMDELLAIALLAVHMKEEPATLVQKQSQEVADLVAAGAVPPETYVIDVGLVHAPEKNLFDHHQDIRLDSSALQIFNAFFRHLQGTELHEYISLVSRVDNHGIKSLDDIARVGESRLYWSFSQQLLLRLFEKDPYPVLRILTAGLQDKIEFEQKTRDGLRWLDEPGNVEVVTLRNVNVLKYNLQPPAHLLSATRAADHAIIEKKDIAATYSFDDKDPQGRLLFRTNRGASKVDFTKARPQNLLFAHKGGFLLRFVPAHEQEWESLIHASLQPAAPSVL